jgi:hypothetical protein
MDLSSWVDPDRAYWLAHPGGDADWDELVAEYGGHRPGPLERVFGVVRESGCATVVVENRYVDADYRSDFAAFWSGRFEPGSSFTRRMHFFARDLDEGDLHDLPEDPGYLGYVILRPTPYGPVGRAVLAPPPSLIKVGATLVLTDDDVSLFGNDLAIRGAPFCQQDREFLRCAHASASVIAYGASRRRLVARHLTADVVALSPPHLSQDRPLPSAGLNYLQLQAIFGSMGMPALMYVLGALPTVLGVPDPEPDEDKEPGEWDTRLFSVISRYINSGFPVLVGTSGHAFVIVGWYKDEAGRMHFVANDDEVGPYDVIDLPMDDPLRGPWEALMVPLPPRVFMTGESAENDAYETLYGLGLAEDAPEAWVDLGRRVAEDAVSRRVMLVRGRDYKRRLRDQGRHDDAVRALSLARMSHWVWVVEAHDRASRRAGEPCVEAEFVYDSTSYDRAPRRLAVSYPGLTITVPPDHGQATVVEGTVGGWQSQLGL